MDLLQTSKPLPWWVLAALGALPVLIFVIAVIVGRRRESLRQAALARVAAELGMGLTPEDNALLSQFGGYAFYPHGDSKRATSVMRGTVRGSPVVLFDYHVTTGSSKNRNTTRLTVAAFDLASRPLPVFEAQGGRDWVTRLLDKALGADKVIDFPDDPDFTRSFCVTGDEAPGGALAPGPGRALVPEAAHRMDVALGRPLAADVPAQKAPQAEGLPGICGGGVGGDASGD
jgi:hypothetical protein